MVVKDSFQDLCVEKNSGVFYLISVYSSSSIAGKRELQNDLMALNNGNEKWEWCPFGEVF